MSVNQNGDGATNISGQVTDTANSFVYTRVWGAQGGAAGDVAGGKGGYVSNIFFTNGDVTYFAGGQGGNGIYETCSSHPGGTGGYPGGGTGGAGNSTTNCINSNATSYTGGGGGGFSAVLSGTNWDADYSFAIAGGGGGAYNLNNSVGYKIAGAAAGTNNKNGIKASSNNSGCNWTSYSTSYPRRGQNGGVAGTQNYSEAGVGAGGGGAAGGMASSAGAYTTCSGGGGTNEASQFLSNIASSFTNYPRTTINGDQSMPAPTATGTNGTETGHSGQGVVQVYKLNYIPYMAPGEDSVVETATTQVRACGGGSGTGNNMAFDTANNAGGSSGGDLSSGATPTKAGCEGQGNSGGATAEGLWRSPGGGGAGSAGAAGENNSSDTTNNAGKGGMGKYSNITGSLVCYAGGGGGSTTSSTDAELADTGGSNGTAVNSNGGACKGGGGANGVRTTSNGKDASANTGGGGSGAVSADGDKGFRLGGAGGSGIVVIRFPYVNADAVDIDEDSGTITVAEQYNDNYDIVTFTPITENGAPSETAEYILVQGSSPAELEPAPFTSPSGEVPVLDGVTVAGTVLQYYKRGEVLAPTSALAAHFDEGSLFYRVVAVTPGDPREIIAYYEIKEVGTHEKTSHCPCEQDGSCPDPSQSP
jgi:hypothetical protein